MARIDMDREHLNEWAQIIRRAEARLRERPPAARWVAVRRFPVFGDWRSYTLGETEEGWRLVRRVWRQFVDNRKLDTPLARPESIELTIEESSVLWGAEPSEDILTRLSKASVSLYVGPNVGAVEGERCELQVQGGVTDIRVSWTTLPETWRPMELVFVDVERRLEVAVGGAS